MLRFALLVDWSCPRVAILTASMLALTGCGDPPGTPCAIVGSGFHARHDCRHQCLSRWHVTCPKGKRVTPNVCSGVFGCTPGSCPDGQVCYHDEDPFDDRSFCVMSTTCGELGDDALAEWEGERVAVQERVREERAEREERRVRWRAENPDAQSTALEPASVPEQGLLRGRPLGDPKGQVESR